MERHWAESYVGIPYSECDCAQLCVRVQHQRFKKLLDIPLIRPSGLHEISDMISNLQDDFATIVAVPEEGDAVLMIGRGRLNHIGIACYIKNQLYVLHAMRSAGMTVLHNIVVLNSIGIDVEGYYKWK